MIVSRQDSGRVLQKRRTRQALITAAAALVAKGQRPSVADAADAALVSRATAYRYFRSQRALLLDVALQAIHPDVGPALKGAGDDVFARFDVVCSAIFNLVTANEAQMRTMLQVTQEEWMANQGNLPALRQGRRLNFIEEALEPVRGRLRPTAFKRLVNSLACLVGIEPYVVLRDGSGLRPKAALETMRWAGHALITASLGLSTERDDQGAAN